MVTPRRRATAYALVVRSPSPPSLSVVFPWSSSVAGHRDVRGRELQGRPVCVPQLCLKFGQSGKIPNTKRPLAVVVSICTPAPAKTLNPTVAAAGDRLRRRRDVSGSTLSTSPHKRGMEIMRLWPPGFHTWPSLLLRIWWTTETDGHAHSIRRQSHQAFRKMFLVRKIGDLQPLTLQDREPLLHLVHPGAMHGWKVQHSVDVWLTRLAPVCPYASVHYRGSHDRCDGRDT